MKIYTTLASAILLSTLTFTQASAQDGLEIFNDTVKVNRGDQFHIFLKSFSQPIKDYLANAKRIAVDFETTTPNTITVGGAWFQPSAEGFGKVKMVVYQESPYIKDYPDWTQKLDSLEFTVNVLPKRTPAALPYINKVWGMSKADAIADMQNHYELYSDTYYAMNPSLTQEERQLFDWFLNPDFDYPLLALGWNDDGQLYSSNIILADRARLGFNSESEVSGYLEDDGFELLGYDETGLFVAYRESDHTQASAGNITLQGQYFPYINFQYSPKSPLAVDRTTLTQPNARISRNGSTVTIETGEDADQQVRIFTANGKLIADGKLHNGTNTFTVTVKGPVIVRVGKHAGVKIM